MLPTEKSPSGQAPSAVWLWGFWIFVAAATAALLVSLLTPPPIDRIFRIASGLLFIVGGIHNGRVVAYKRQTRNPYSVLGPDALITQRQTGWSAIVMGILFIGSAVVGL